MLRTSALVLLGLASTLQSGAQELTFRHAMELALQHSGAVAIANADQARARANMEEARNAYVPALTLGSGLAWTYGFPLSIEGSAPSIVNFNAQSIVFNAPQHEFVQALRRDWMASRFSTQDRRNRVILEAAEVYTELDNAESSLKVLAQQQQAAQKAEQIVTDRVHEGVDSEVELTRAKLQSAKAELKMAEMQGAADTARTRLGQLTGLAADSIHTLTESIPALPEVDQSADLAGLAVKASPLVQQASQEAEGKRYRAKGEHKVYYPSIDFVAQYGLFSKANNFQDFFQRFQRNNATVGAAIRIPFFNLSGKAHAEAADAEAVAARKQSQEVQNEVANQALKLQRSVRQLAAAKEIARLEHQLSQADLEVAQTQAKSGNLSLKDVASAQVKEQESYIGYLDASFALEKAQLELMNSTNELQEWALPGSAQ